MKKSTFEVRVLYGELELRSMAFELPSGAVPRKVGFRAEKGREILEAKVEREGLAFKVVLEKPSRIRSGESLTFTVNAG
ncbi:MAG: hypothetical protein QXF24_06360 [Thermoproteota archaeon]